MPKANDPPKFFPGTLPPLDRIRQQIEDYVAAQSLSQSERFVLRNRMFDWMRNGFVVLEKAIPDDLIDALLGDVEDTFADHRSHGYRVLSDVYDHVPLRDTDPALFYGQRMRLVDFHQSSIAAKKISLHRNILDFVDHLFREEVVMMQSLLFLEGSQQLLHQDHAYVVAKIPSHLCATWVALEDIDPASGPLRYVPCSHALPMFDWGNGMFRGPGSTKNEHDFADHIETEARRASLAATPFCPRKGDVFVWHAALAHGGSAVTDSELTRKSYVTHYSVSSTFKTHHRDPLHAPIVEKINGALVYQDRANLAEENSLLRGADL